MERIINIGIIGCGKQANIHYLMIRELPNFRLVALCDKNPEAIDSFINSTTHKKKDLFITDDYKKLIREGNVDAVLIATHTKFHIEQALYAIKHKKHVLIEKPLGINISEVDTLIEAAMNSDVVVYPGMHYIHSNYFANLKNYVSSEFLSGTKYIVVTEHRQNFFLPWFYDSEASGGAINDKFIHYFNLVSELFYPSKPLEVYAVGFQHVFKSGSELSGLFSEKYELENPTIVDNAHIIVKFEDEKICTFALNMYQKTPVEGLQVYVAGLNGNFCRIINADTPGYKLITHDSDGNISDFQLKDQSDTDKFGAGHPGSKRLLIDFYKAINQEKGFKPRVNLWKARVAQAIAFAAEESIKSNKAVSLQKFANKKLRKLAEIKKLDYEIVCEEYEIEKVPEENSIKKPVRIGFLSRLRRLGRNNIGLRYKPLNTQILKKTLARLEQKNYNIDYLDGTEFKFIVESYWDSSLLEIKNKQVSVSKLLKTQLDKEAKTPKIVLTKRGWEGLLQKKSLNFLYMTRAIKTENVSNINQLRPLNVIVGDILDELRKVSIIN